MESRWRAAWRTGSFILNWLMGEQKGKEMGDNPNQTEPQFKCLYKESNSGKVSGDNIVKVVFYAIVVSVLASAYFAIPDDKTPALVGHIHTWTLLPGFITTIHSKLGDCWKWSAFWMLPLSYFLFFTGYFYDEWRRSSSVTKLNCRDILDFLAWMVFTIQVSLVQMPKLSVILGIIGCIFASVSLLINKEIPWTYTQKTGWIIQNVIWIVALSLLIVAGNWSYVVLLASVFGIFVYKAIIWLVNK